jgi:hypothetical protein
MNTAVAAANRTNAMIGGSTMTLNRNPSVAPVSAQRIANAVIKDAFEIFRPGLDEGVSFLRVGETPRNHPCQRLLPVSLQ